MLDARESLLYSKLCRHNVDNPICGQFRFDSSLYQVLSTNEGKLIEITHQVSTRSCFKLRKEMLIYWKGVRVRRQKSKNKNRMKRNFVRSFPPNSPNPKKPGYKYPGSRPRVHSDARRCFVPCNFVFIFNLFLFHVSITLANSFFIYENF